MRRTRVVQYSLPVVLAALACWSGWSAVQRGRQRGDARGGTGAELPPAPQTEDRAVPPAVPLHPLSTAVTEARLKGCIGKSVAEVVQQLDLGKTEWRWTAEPPGVLRGVTYTLPERQMRMTLYIAEGEPLYRTFSDRFEWNYEAFLGCRVGGIQYHSGEIWLDIGPAVPWQWRRH